METHRASVVLHVSVVLVSQGTIEPAILSWRVNSTDQAQRFKLSYHTYGYNLETTVNWRWTIQTRKHGCSTNWATMVHHDHRITALQYLPWQPLVDQHLQQSQCSNSSPCTALRWTGLQAQRTPSSYMVRVRVVSSLKMYYLIKI